VAEQKPLDIDDVWTPAFAIGQDEPIITAGSCFAARIGPALLDAGMNWFDAEAAPPGLTPEQRQARGYGAFSFRTGNIYTPAVLRQWLSWALGRTTPPQEAWQDGDRFYDPYRPAIEPDGWASPQEMLESRETTLAAIRTAVSTAACLVFTMGLTEAWLDTDDKTVYSACPGTVRGVFDARRHTFHNFTVAEVERDLTEAITLARSINPGLRILLTVSPQPLTATATAAHALTANSHTKSVLRAAAGELATRDEQVDYFPSYELISSAPFRGMFYAPNLRAVTPDGVAFVMRHFLAAVNQRNTDAPQQTQRAPRPLAGGDECEDALLDYYAPR
jgi:hypothetical protein